nr:hypothetical protein [Tanacetum cinerariifolium]
VTQPVTTPIRQYTRRVRNAQSSALPTVVDEHASLVRDVSKGEACPIESGFIADQDRATIANSSTLPHDSALRAQEVEILKLKDRVKVLEDREGIAATRSRDDAPINRRSIDEREAATERIGDDLEELARVLTCIDAATVLAGGIDIPTGSGSISTAGPPVVDIHTGSDAVPTASPIVATATVIDAQVARELEEQQEMEDKRMTEQIARDAEVVRIHAKEELQEEVPDKEKSPEEIPEEKVKEMMQLVPIEEVYIQSLQVKHPIIDWKVELKRLYEPDPEDQLWAQTQNYMHAPIEWKLYDLSGVHHVTAKDNEIFMLVEKDYPLRKGLALVMICYKLQVENFSQMANDLVLKIYKIANSPRQQGD